MPGRSKISIKDLVFESDKMESRPPVMFSYQQSTYVPLYTSSSMSSLQGCSTVVHAPADTKMPYPPAETPEAHDDDDNTSDDDDNLSTSGESSEQTEVRKGVRPKHVHRMAERRRRRQMSNVFEELSQLVRPAGGHRQKKWEVLASSLDTIDELTARRDALKRERDFLRQKLDPRFLQMS